MKLLLIKWYKHVHEVTWEKILLTLLGITDHFYQNGTNQDKGIVFTPLTFQKLADLLFTGWIMSGMRDANLWNKFTNYAKKWTYEDWFHTKWASVVNATTHKVLRDYFDERNLQIKIDAQLQLGDPKLCAKLPKSPLILYNEVPKQAQTMPASRSQTTPIFGPLIGTTAPVIPRGPSPAPQSSGKNTSSIPHSFVSRSRR
jgi:hypothetical protein